jgi:hypothetical protein
MPGAGSGRSSATHPGSLRAGGRGRSRALQGASFWGTSPDVDWRRRAGPTCRSARPKAESVRRSTTAVGIPGRRSVRP